MNKARLVSHLAAEPSTTGDAAERMAGAMLSAIADALARDEPEAIARFGKFAVRGRAAHQGSNPRAGEPVAVPASRVPSFKLAKALRDAVNRITSWGRRPHARYPFPQCAGCTCVPWKQRLLPVAPGFWRDICQIS